MPRHVVHVAVEAARQPTRQVCLGLVEAGVANSQLLKAELFAPAPYLLRELVEIDVGVGFYHDVKDNRNELP